MALGLEPSASEQFRDDKTMPAQNLLTQQAAPADDILQRSCQISSEPESRMEKRCKCSRADGGMGTNKTESKT